MPHPLLKYKTEKPTESATQKPSESDEQIKALIKRRRLQMVYHSYIYYHLHTNVISDDLWQAWADQLTQLQKDYPHCCEIGIYDYEFKDWSGTTGMHLPHSGIERGMAEYIVELHEKYQNSANF
jgi:hypothetical protein